MLLAELEIRHSRPIAPTRRVALGKDVFLPTDPAPGFGGVLLACIVATFGQELDEEMGDELDDLLEDLERGRRISQPRLRHRFQVDVIGLDRSHHRLYGQGDSYHLDLQMKGHPMPQVLGAAYAAGMLSRTAKTSVFRLLRKATLFAGEPGPKMLAFLLGGEAASKSWTTAANDERWARAVLGFDAADFPDADDVGRRYRDLVRLAHPDVGGDATVAGHRITELNEARRVLLRVG
ncbi:MAG: J domain-containing protein [Acidimicrobiales bacterium]